MKTIIRFTITIFLLGFVVLISCKKDNSVITPPPPAKATINFHIKNSFVVPAGSIYLYRLISTTTSNIYDSTQNIYLRPNIDTTFIYKVDGNTSNVFIIGIPDPDEIPYYIENRYIVAGSSVNWNIEY